MDFETMMVYFYGSGTIIYFIWNIIEPSLFKRYIFGSSIIFMTVFALHREHSKKD